MFEMSRPIVCALGYNDISGHERYEKRLVSLGPLIFVADTHVSSGLVDVWRKWMFCLAMATFSINLIDRELSRSRPSWRTMAP